jgi:predicted ATPase/DNA-binding SARP family transcriptional activator
VWADDGREVAVGGSRLRALLARLLVDPGKVVGTGRLIDDLYGDQPPAGAANALQSQVSRLRRALPQPSLVEFHPAGYRLAAEPEDVDAHRFARLAAEGHRALAAGDHPRAAELLAEALELWRGPALADVVDAPFAAAQLARLDGLRLAALEDRIEADLALGQPGPLVPELQSLVEEHPLRERLGGLLMRALYGSGRQAEALAVFEDVRRRLADELGADPSPELAAVHLAVLRADELLVPASGVRRGLPAQLTSFVGREDELRRVGKLLGEARLVTLTGPGGAGKTRLAIEAAGRYMERAGWSGPGRWVGGGESCFVELAALGAGADVPQAVLTALGLRDARLRDAGPRAAADGRLTPTDRLVAALTDRPLLLVLDNCEHVVADAAALADRLLSGCPLLRILVTSREPLGLTGEALCPLSGLAMPSPDAAPADAVAYPAVRLFADRAADVTPGFTLDPGNLGAVLRICRTLDGLPLAIELAAARLRSLPVAEIAARLDDRFALLSRGSRAAQPRHRTLRAVVEWSWGLLDEDERVLVRRLAVFASGASLTAAERVTGLPGVVDLLASLVDKSLVEAVDGAGDAGGDVGGGRYRMLDTVRAFAAERLAEAGETERLRRAHAAYFLDLAWTADPHLRRAEQLEWLARLDEERDNLHAALRGAVAAGDLAPAMELVAALSSYWWLRGLRTEGAVLASEVLAALGPEPPAGRAEEYALCVLNAAVGGFGGRDLPRQVAATAWARGGPGHPPRQPVLSLLAALVAGPPEGGVDPTMVEQRQVLLGDDPWSLALGPLGVGYMRLWDGQLAEAEQEFAGALAAFRALGERWGITNTIAALAEIAERHGDRAGSVTLIDEAMRLAGELGAVGDSADLLRLRGAGGLRAGELDAAHADYRRAASLARRAGSPEVLAAARLGLAEVAMRRGDRVEARRLAELALAECPTGWFLADATRADALVLLGRIAEAEQDPGAARARYREAVAVAAGVKVFPTPIDALSGQVRIALGEGDGERAALLLGAATTLLRQGPWTGGLDVVGLSATARSLVGDTAYEAAVAQGSALTRTQAMDLFGA